MNRSFFAAVLLAAIVVFLLLRIYCKNKFYRAEERRIVARALPPSQRVLQFLLGLSTIVPPLLWTFSGSLQFADFRLALTAREGGVVLALLGLLFLWWTHVVLAANWSPSAEIREGHTLTTGGPFRYVRHPMYTAFFFFYASFLLLSANWIVGLLPLVLFFIILCLRLPAEEALLDRQFGDAYRQYRMRTRRFIPFVV